MLGPKAASDSGKPSTEARRFIDETTAPDRPRVYRNAVVLAVPSKDGLDIARGRIREHLAWEEVRGQLKDQDIDPIRSETLSANLESARKQVPEAIRQAYCIVVTVSEKNEVQAFKIAASDDPLFMQIKSDSRSRIQDTPVSADALLPGGPYDLWREGETSRRVSDLVGAFAQFPHLPKMLRRKEILDTLVLGAREGFFVLRTTRPDRSVRTFWRQQPDEAALKDPSLEVVLPESASLSELASDLLLPGVLPQLWKDAVLMVKDISDYFSGGRVVQIQRESYAEPVTVPKVEREVIEIAINMAVKEGKLWLTSGPASILSEEIPAGLLTDDAQLQAPPSPISPLAILPQSLPEAWNSETTTALAIAVALSRQAGKTLPLVTVRAAIDGALKAQLLERALDSSSWPCDFAGAQKVGLRVPTEKEKVRMPPPPLPQPGVRIGEAELRPNEIQDLADVIGDIVKASVGCELKLQLRIELGGDPPPTDQQVENVNKLLEGVSKDLRLK